MSSKFVHSDCFDARYQAWKLAQAEHDRRYKAVFETEEARMWKASETALQAIRRLLIVACEHPEAEWQEFTWNHSNGYGSHSTRKGVRCGVCQQVNHYPGTSRSFYVETHDRDDD